MAGFKVIDMPSLVCSDVLVRMKLAFLLAVTVPTLPAGAVSDPVPVQPLTLKVLPCTKCCRPG